MIFIGCDPDTQRTAWAAVADYHLSGLPRVLSVGLTKSDKGLKGRDAVKSMILRMCGPCEARPLDTGVPQAVRIAVEAQEIAYSAGQGVSPRSVAMLGPISGAAIACACRWWDVEAVEYPSPQAWKGSVPKAIHHARIAGKIGMAYKLHGGERGYAGPNGPDAWRSGNVPAGVQFLNNSDWKHVMDAIGLALWCKEEYNRNQNRDALLQSRRTA